MDGSQLCSKSGNPARIAPTRDDGFDDGLQARSIEPVLILFHSRQFQTQTKPPHIVRSSEPGPQAIEPWRPLPEWKYLDWMGWNEQGDGKYMLGINVEQGRIRDTPELKIKTALRKLVAGAYFPGVGHERRLQLSKS